MKHKSTVVKITNFRYCKFKCNMHTERHMTPFSAWKGVALHCINYVIISNPQVVLYTYLSVGGNKNIASNFLGHNEKNKGVWSLKQFQAHYEIFIEQLSKTWESFCRFPIQEGNVILNIRIDIMPVLQIRCQSVDLYHHSYSHLSHWASLPSLLLSPEHHTVHYDDLKCSHRMRGK